MADRTPADDHAHRPDLAEDRDAARAVREEDAFDVAAVDAWLRAEAADWVGELPPGPPSARQFPGGASNLTYLLAWGEDRELILRRPPRGAKAKSAHDMGREHRIQAALHPVLGRVPRMAAYAPEDASPLDAECYVMERLRGTILRQDLPAGVALDADAARRLSTLMIDTLVDLHAVDVEAAGLADLGRGPGYVGRQVSGWTDRYARARTEDVPDFARVAAWVAEHQPADVGACLIHNDFRLDNLVLDGLDGLGGDPRVVGILDWELATVGDPLMDVGSVVAYWTQGDDDELFQLFRRQPTHLPGMLTRAEVWAHYGERTGHVVEPAGQVWYETFGLFRLAVIAQQIYYRYFHGQTTNQSFAILGQVVTELEKRCTRLIETGDGNDRPVRDRDGSAGAGR